MRVQEHAIPPGIGSLPRYIRLSSRVAVCAHAHIISRAKQSPVSLGTVAAVYCQRCLVNITTEMTLL